MTLARHPEDRKPFRLTVDDYRVLHEAGAFDRGPKVELIEGVILEMNPQRNRHSFAKTELGFRLREKLREIGSPLRAVIEPTIALSQDSAPEPDIALTSDQPHNDFVRLDTVALLIEVASTTLAYDLGRKAALYAASGVPEYWVLDLRKAVLHRHWAPSGGSYSNQDVLPLDGPIQTVTIPDLSIESDGLI